MSQPNQLYEEKPNSIAPIAGDGFEPGHMLGGRYQVLSTLGHGGMGIVYRVKQIFLDKEMALKTISKHCITDTAIRRFQQEAQTSFAVDHANVIEVSDFGLLDDDTPFLVMELLVGETLGDKLKREKRLTVDDAISVFVQVCFGLAHAHDVGIVHRDIKPNNIMLLSNQLIGTEGSVKIVDFGIAKYSSRDGGELQALTRTGEVFGSPLYMSPEQCGGGLIDHRSDIYSLGCVLYEALTGLPPCIGENALLTMTKHQTAIPVSLKEASGGIVFPPQIEKLVAKMLEKDPSNRYQNLGLVAHELAALKNGGKSIPKPKVSSLELRKRDEEKISMSIPAFAGMLIGIAAVTALTSYQAIFMIVSEPAKVAKPLTNVASKIADIGVKEKSLDPTEKRSPEDVKRMIKDELAYLRFIELTPASVDALSTLSQVKDIDLRSAILPNEHLFPLKKLHIRKISFSDSTITDAGFEQLLPQNQIEALQLNKTEITDKSMSAVARMPSLENLDLSGTKITDEGLLELSKSSSLRWLALNNCAAFSDKGISYLKRIPNLGVLELAGTAVTDKALYYISGFPRLEKIDLTETHLSADDLDEFCEHSHVTEIYLKNSLFIKPDDIFALIKKYRRIHFLYNEDVHDSKLDKPK